MEKSFKPSKQPKSNNPVTVEATWSGPLPPPQVLQSFNEIVDNGAERIMQMAESEQKHRIALEHLAITSEINATSRGQWMGAWVSSIAIIGAVVVSLLGVHWSIPVAMVGVPVASVIIAFLKRS